MPVLSRRGITLIELLFSLILMSVIGVAINRVLVSNERMFQMQSQRVDQQQNMRAATVLFAGEFRELDAVDGDIIAMGANSITIRAMRQLAFICSAPALPAAGGVGPVTLTVRNTPFFGSRAFVAGDSLLIFYEGDATIREDDAWHLGRINPAGVVAQNCPAAAGNSPGTRLTVALQNSWVAPHSNLANMITSGSPVRGFEVVTYLAYQAADGRWYVGLQNAAGTQPIVGPINGSTGLAFTYFNAAGGATAVPTSVARIGVAVRTEAAQAVHNPGGGGALVTAIDSITTQVSLRNNPRF